MLRFRQPVQLDLLAEQDSLVRRMVIVHAHIVEIRRIRNRHEAGIG